MILVKKLFLAPLLLVVFGLLVSRLAPFLKSYEFIFSLSWDTLTQMIILAGLIILFSFFFSLYTTFAQELKFVLPVGLAAAFLPMLTLDPSLGLIFAVGILCSLLLTYFTLINKLQTYLTFESNSLLGPSIRHLTSLLILTLSVVYFLSINQTVQNVGFQIPDAIIDTALKFTAPAGGETTQQEIVRSSLTPEQIDLLKQNPDLLAQYGLDLKMLDNLNQPTTKQTSTPAASNEVIKQTVKTQLQNILQPYVGIIPAVLAVILFITLQSLVSILTLFIYPLLWIIFYILEKVGFVKFEIEQRTVKKMVV